VTLERDPNNVHEPQVIDVIDTSFTYELNFFNSNNQQTYPHGHVIHANCWILVERRTGHEVENNLELFLEICRERFHENPYDIHEYRSPKTKTNKPISKPTRRWRNPLEPAPGLDSSRHHPDIPDDPRQSIPLRALLNIPEIPRLIHHSAQNKAKEIIKRKPRKWSSATFSSGEQRKSPWYYRVTQFPCEIVFLILDNLSRRADIRNALIAFNWKVPDMYWKARVPYDLVFELQDVRERFDDFD
jgi:hypothetical protein